MSFQTRPAGHHDVSSLIMLLPNATLGDSQAIAHLRSGLKSVDFDGTVVQRLLSTCGEIGRVTFAKTYSSASTCEEIALQLAQNAVLISPSSGELELSPRTLAFESHSGLISGIPVTYAPGLASIAELPSFIENIWAIIAASPAMDLEAIERAATEVRFRDINLVLPGVIRSSDGDVDAFVSLQAGEDYKKALLYVSAYNHVVPQTGKVFQRTANSLVPIGTFERRFE